MLSVKPNEILDRAPDHPISSVYNSDYYRSLKAVYARKEREQILFQNRFERR
jgi:hypothetical protein